MAHCTAAIATLLFVPTLCTGVALRFEEHFDGSYTTRWHAPNFSTGEQLGTWSLQPLHHDKGLLAEFGLQTRDDGRQYALWARMETFNNWGKILTIQFTVKHTQRLTCGGGYLKLLSPDRYIHFQHSSLPSWKWVEQLTQQEPSQMGLTLVHLVSKVYPIKHSIPCPADRLTHVYTLVLHPTNTFKVLLDNKVKYSGSLYTDFDLLPPAEIADPAAEKPEDWDDRPLIDDPSMTKPRGWEDQIPDPTAKQPRDWDDERNGKWEASSIPNPRGIWTPGRIDNPAYKGRWKAPLIPNPEFVDDPELCVRNLGYVAFELHQDQSGTIFDDILVCEDCEQYAREQAAMRLARSRHLEEADRAAEAAVQNLAKVAAAQIKSRQERHKSWEDYFDYTPDDFSHPDDSSGAAAYQEPNYWYEVYHTDDFSNPDLEFPDSGIIHHDEL